MTGDKKYSFEDHLDLKSIRNHLVQYDPDEYFPHQYSTRYTTLHTVDGPMDPLQVDMRHKKVHYLPQDYFDACADEDTYRSTSYRGKRRQHALQLAADYRGMSLFHFEEWFDDNNTNLLSDLLDLIRAFCHGVRVTFEDKNVYWYQLNPTIMDQIQDKLKEIRKRTEQVAKITGEDIPPIPEFGYSTKHQYPNLRQAFFSSNDWEILAAAYRKEVETFVQTCIYLGFDHQPYEASTSSKADELQESEYPEDHEPIPTLSPSVKRIIEESFKDQLRLEDSQSQQNISQAQQEDINFSSPIHEEEHTYLPPPTHPSVMKSPSKSQFTPQETSTPNIIPSYREEQVKRVYGAPPALESIKEGTGTERFHEMFKPSRYSHNPDVTVYSAPEVPRAAQSIQPSYGQSRAQFSFDPSNTSHISTGGAIGYGHPDLSNRPLQPIDSRFGIPGNDPPSGGSSNKGSSHGTDGNRPPQGPGIPGNGPPRHGGPPGRGYPGPPGGNPPSPPPGGAAAPYGRNNNPNHGVVQTGLNKWVNIRETHFDTKLKPEIVPVWNGDEGTLGRWITQLNELALRSASVFKGLGDIAPTRFRDKALSWWYSLQDTHRTLVSENWDTLKDEIRTYWMNPAWIERTQRKALRVRY
jgi:hypothetical protein